MRVQRDETNESNTTLYRTHATVTVVARTVPVDVTVTTLLSVTMRASESLDTTATLAAVPRLAFPRWGRQSINTSYDVRVSVVALSQLLQTLEAATCRELKPIRFQLRYVLQCPKTAEHKPSVRNVPFHRLHHSCNGANFVDVLCFVPCHFKVVELLVDLSCALNLREVRAGGQFSQRHNPLGDGVDVIGKLSQPLHYFFNRFSPLPPRL